MLHVSHSNPYQPAKKIDKTKQLLQLLLAKARKITKREEVPRIPPSKIPHRTHDKPAMDKCKPLQICFSSVQDYETLEKYMQCKPVSERFDLLGDGSLHQLSREGSMMTMRDCTQYWALCLSK